MVFDDFINKWNGKGIDFDGAYGDQCMDLMHQYIVEVCGLTDGRILAAPAAKDVYLNFTNVFGHENFDKIDNTPTGVPQKGDIMFWGTGIGQYGHVSIFQSGDANAFTSFDQNWSGHQYCELVNHTYNAVLGWLRFRGAPTTAGDIYNGYDLTNKESMKVAVDVLVKVQQGQFVPRSDVDAICGDLGIATGSNKDVIIAAINSLKADKSTAQATAEKAKKDYETDEQTIGNLNKTITDKEGEISTLNNQVLDLQQKLTAAQSAATHPDSGLDYQALYTQAETDLKKTRQTLADLIESTNRQIAQLKNSSFSSASTSALWNELAKRLFRVK